MTHQRHPRPLPIHKINGVAFRVVNAQVNQDDHDMVSDDIGSYVEEVHRQLCIELDVRFRGQRVRPARLEAHKPKDRFRRHAIDWRQTVRKTKKGTAKP
jgi:hypothetical protein